MALPSGSFTKDEFISAYYQWVTELEDELVRRTGYNLDNFPDYPDLDYFLFEPQTPTEAVNGIILSRNLREIKPRPFYVVPKMS
ncbi:MAG: hypothetical protein P4L38_12400 [Syntrophaceae bacterium]|nr:hypothetical protein [Syntrophaceae bacterium]